MITINEAGRRINAALNELAIRVDEAQQHNLKPTDRWYGIIRCRAEKSIHAALSAVGCKTLAEFAQDVASDARIDEAFNRDWTNLKGLVTDGVRTMCTHQEAA